MNPITYPCPCCGAPLTYGAGSKLTCASCGNTYDVDAIEAMTAETGAAFFAAQTYTAAAVDADTGTAYGLYILHPNNVGRCGHICNASYAVERAARGLHIGEKLVSDCLAQGRAHGFRVLQFNAVVASNTHARHLYERLGFVQLGVIPGGFRMKDGHYEDICPYYHTL